MTYNVIGRVYRVRQYEENETALIAEVRYLIEKRL